MNLIHIWFPCLGLWSAGVNVSVRDKHESAAGRGWSQFLWAAPLIDIPMLIKRKTPATSLHIGSNCQIFLWLRVSPFVYRLNSPILIYWILTKFGLLENGKTEPLY